LSGPVFFVKLAPGRFLRIFAGSWPVEVTGSGHGGQPSVAVADSLAGAGRRFFAGRRPARPVDCGFLVMSDDALTRAILDLRWDLATLVRVIIALTKAIEGKKAERATEAAEESQEAADTLTSPGRP
jgi:hypothetical protein